MSLALVEAEAPADQRSVGAIPGNLEVSHSSGIDRAQLADRSDRRFGGAGDVVVVPEWKDDDVPSLELDGIVAVGETGPRPTPNHGMKHAVSQVPGLDTPGSVERGPREDRPAHPDRVENIGKCIKHR
jgi:hypothetical protein